MVLDKSTWVFLFQKPVSHPLTVVIFFDETRRSKEYKIGHEQILVIETAFKPIIKLLRFWSQFFSCMILKNSTHESKTMREYEMISYEAFDSPEIWGEKGKNHKRKLDNR